MGEGNGETDPLRLGRASQLALALLLLALLAAMAQAHYQAAAAGTRLLADFDAFHLAGALALEGRLAEAYNSTAFAALQAEAAPGRGFMPWSYPPQFALLAAPLALLPAWAAFLLLAGGSLAAYLLALRALAGERAGGVAAMLLPVLLIGLLTGQNGFLTGALIGAVLALALRGGQWAGVPLGLLVVKPHLGLGLGAWLLLAGRWRWIAQALAVVAVTALLATLAFGPAPWPAFLRGLEATSALMEAGSYSLHRMTSAYALLRSLGADPAAALGAQAGVALMAVAAVAWAQRQGWATRRVLALATLATLFVSPYLHDYDLTVLGLALALAAPDLAAPGARPLLPAVAALAWASCAYPYAAGWLAYRRYLLGADLGPEDRPPALAALALLALAVLLLALLRRAEREGHPAAPAPA